MKNRRNFLKIIGLGITGSILKPVGSSAQNAALLNKSVKIGVLLPQSNEHPQYPESFLNGLRLALNSENNASDSKKEIITEQVKFGSPYLVKSKIQQLISENKVNVVIALVNTAVVNEISDIVQEAKIPVIIANAGENYPMKKLRSNPYLFFNTLNLYQNAYMSGEYAVKNFGKNMAVVTSQYDSGYDALYSFYKGIEVAGGNETTTFIKKGDEKDFVNNTLDQIEKSDFNGIYVYLNGSEADDFIRRAKIRNIKMPVITTSFVSDESRLVHLGNSAEELLSFGAWSIHLKNQENRDFVHNYNSAFYGKPDQFAFLGYESAQIVASALSNCNADFNGENLARNISNCAIQSPGGSIAVNKETGYVQNQVYLHRTEANLFGFAENKAIQSFTPIDESNHSFIALESEMRSGFTSPYLFV